MSLDRASLLIALATLVAAASAQSTPYASIPGSASLFTIPTFAAGADVMHGAWNLGSGNPPGTWYSRSADRGRTWLATPPSFPGSLLGMAASGLDVYLLVSDATGGASYRSSDGGLTWGQRSNFPLSLSEARIVANGPVVHVLRTWPAPPVDYAVSTDGGSTWTPTTISATAAGGYPRPQMAVAGNFVHVMWHEANRVSRYSRSADGGATWQPPQPVPLVDASFAIVAAGSNVWQLVQHASSSFIARSTDGGANWSSVVPVPTGVVSRLYPPLGDVDGSGVCFASLGTARGTVLLFTSVDAGQTWQTTTQPIPYFPATGSWSAQLTSLVYRNATIAAAFTLVNNGGSRPIPQPGSVLISNDRGATWLPGQLIETPPAAFNGPQLLPAPDSMAVAWSASYYPVSSAGLRSCLLFGYQPYGTAKPGTSAIAPRLDGSGEPHTGNTAGVIMSQALGGSPAVIAASFAGPASLPFASGTLLVQPPILATVGSTSGATGIPGAGAMSLQFAIPTGNAYRNQRIDFQGFVLDAGAADGFASSAALEMWTF